MKKWAIVFVIALVALAAGGRHILLHWQIFPHVSILALQRSYHSSIDEYFIDRQYRKPAFSRMFNEPSKYTLHVDRYLLDPDSSAMELEVASILVQCRSRNELHQLGDKIIARFDKAIAAERLMLVFIPFPSASTFHYASLPQHPYQKWFDFIEKHHPHVGGKPIDLGLEENAYFTSHTNRELASAPVKLCPNEQNVADMEAYVAARKAASNY